VCASSTGKALGSAKRPLYTLRKKIIHWKYTHNLNECNVKTDWSRRENRSIIKMMRIPNTGRN
jgi:hypothetical protein